MTETKKGKVKSFATRKDKMTTVLNELTEIYSRGNFNINTKIASSEKKTINVKICENLREFLNMLTIKTMSGNPRSPVTETIESTEFKRYRILEGVMASGRDTCPEMAFLFEENLLKTGTSCNIELNMMADSMKVKSKLIEGIGKVIENLIAYTELEKDTVVELGYTVERD